MPLIQPLISYTATWRSQLYPLSLLLLCLIWGPALGSSRSQEFNL